MPDHTRTNIPAPEAASRRAVMIGMAAFLGACARQGEADTSTLPVLRIGDQNKTVRPVLTAAGEDQPETYRLEWSNFTTGGPGVVAAHTGGSIDVGWMAGTPLVFAQAAGSPVKVVAARYPVDPRKANFALVTLADSPINTVADLKGKSVGFAQGTNMHYLVLSELEKAGLTLNDIKPVQLQSLSLANLDNGAVDAFTAFQPYLSLLLSQGRIKVLAPGDDLYFLTASDTALADARKAEIIGDFVSRVARATRWQRENTEKAVPYTVEAFNGIPPEVARHILETAPARWVPIDEKIIARHQHEVDTFFRHGLIRQQVDAAALFDARYNDLVVAAEA